jgi:hypothetical protein
MRIVILRACFGPKASRIRSSNDRIERVTVPFSVQCVPLSKLELVTAYLSVTCDEGYRRMATVFQEVTLCKLLRTRA